MLRYQSLAVLLWIASGCTPLPPPPNFVNDAAAPDVPVTEVVTADVNAPDADVPIVDVRGPYPDVPDAPDVPDVSDVSDVSDVVSPDVVSPDVVSPDVVSPDVVSPDVPVVDVPVVDVPVVDVPAVDVPVVDVPVVDVPDVLRPPGGPMFLTGTFVPSGATGALLSGGFIWQGNIGNARLSGWLR